MYPSQSPLPPPRQVPTTPTFLDITSLSFLIVVPTCVCILVGFLSITVLFYTLLLPPLDEVS